MSDTTVLLRARADLNHGVDPTPLRRLMATGDQLAHRIEVAVTRDGAPVDLTGVTVSGGFLRADDVMVLLGGQASGNTAQVTLPQACYRVSGPFSLAVRLTRGAEVTTVFWGQGTVTRLDSDTVTDPEQRIPSLEALLGQLERLEAGTAASEDAARQANAAAQSATAAAGSAGAAAQAASTAAQSATTAAQSASSAAQSATTAAQAANTAATAASTAAGRVDEARARSAGAAQRAEDAATAAVQATDAATQATTAAAQAAGAAAQATGAAARATAAAERWQAVEAEVTMLAPDAPPVVTITDTDTGKRLSFELPRGLTGATPQLTVGDIRTGEPGSPAQAWLTGTPEAPVLHLSIPQGLTGAIENLTVNGKPVKDGRVTLTAEDVGAWPNSWVPTAAYIGALPDEPSGVTPGDYGLRADAAPDYGGKVTVPRLTISAAGLVTGAADHVVTLPDVPARILAAQYGSFADAEASLRDRSARAFAVSYNGTDNSAPLAIAGTHWWNVFEITVARNRALQLASHAFRDRNVLYFRVKHDNTWYGWYQLSGSATAAASALPLSDAEDAQAHPSGDSIR